MAFVFAVCWFASPSGCSVVASREGAGVGERQGAEKHQLQLAWMGGKGHSKNKMMDPYVVGWLLGGQKSTRAGQIFFEIFLSCF
jgi:hypothetical protein